MYQKYIFLYFAILNKDDLNIFLVLLVFVLKSYHSLFVLIFVRKEGLKQYGRLLTNFLRNLEGCIEW
jgi:hypothetical protein